MKAAGKRIWSVIKRCGSIEIESSYELDESSVLDQADSAPKRIVNGEAMLLELGGEATIDHRAASGLL